MNENVISILPGSDSYILLLSFDSIETSSLPRENNIKEDIYFSLPGEINAIINNFYNLDFLNEKFDELREKEIDKKITEFEKFLLYEIIEKRIADFPNPYLLSDHKEAMDAVKKFKTLERNFNKKSKLNKRLGLFSWLS